VYNYGDISFDEVFQEHNISTIFHCATEYGISSDIKNIIETNLLLPLQLCEACIRHNVKRFINTDTILDKRINAYSLSKKQFLDWIPYFLNNGLGFFTISLEHFYGPFDSRSKFVSKIIENILNEIDNIPLTAGEQKRDFIFIDDVIDAFMIVYKNINPRGKENLTFEVGTNLNTSIMDLVLKIKTISGNKNTHLDFGAIPYRENEIMESNADTKNIRTLGWNPKVSLEDGLKKTIEIEKNFIKTMAHDKKR
jgi:CDP-paratose synthetase